MRASAVCSRREMPPDIRTNMVDTTGRTGIRPAHHSPMIRDPIVDVMRMMVALRRSKKLPARKKASTGTNSVMR